MEHRVEAADDERLDDLPAHHHHGQRGLGSALRGDQRAEADRVHEGAGAQVVQPEIVGLTSDTLREWNENAWRDRLAPMLQDVPDFERVWKEWVKTLHGLVKKTKLKFTK